MCGWSPLVGAEQVEATENTDTTDAQATDQPQTTEPADPADAPDSAETAQAAEADDSADEVTVEYVATAEGDGQVAAGFGNHDFIDFTDEWTDTEETDAMNASMSTEADQGPVTCEIIVDGESPVAEEDASGSVYCSAVIP